jgi:hypothetical protein
VHKWVVYRLNCEPYEGCDAPQFIGIYDTQDAAVAAVIERNTTPMVHATGVTIGDLSGIHIEMVPYEGGVTHSS